MMKAGNKNKIPPEFISNISVGVSQRNMIIVRNEYDLSSSPPASVTSWSRSQRNGHSRVQEGYCGEEEQRSEDFLFGQL